MVASVAAGKQDKTDITPMHGVAFEADVYLLQFNLLNQIQTMILLILVMMMESEMFLERLTSLE